MQPIRLSFFTAAMLSLAAVLCSDSAAQAQNDWQYPDPYFGILEIEKSHDGVTARRSRSEANPAQRSSAFAAPSAWKAPAGQTKEDATGRPVAAPAPASRPKWRNRWRR